MDTIKKIKVFGERNTGTNFVEELLRENISAVVCDGNLPQWRRKIYKVLYRLLPYSLARNIVESDRDRAYSHRFSENLGWKHARIPNIPPHHSGYPGDVGFVAVTKNPYAWLLSMHKRPYQGTEHNRFAAVPFADFLRKPWRTVGREFSSFKYETPIHMWNDKVSSYSRLQEYRPAIIVRYEEVICDLDAFVKMVAHEFNVGLSSERRIMDKSTKKDGRSTSEITSYYLNNEWINKLSTEDIDFINHHLDRDLMEARGYEFIKP